MEDATEVWMALEKLVADNGEEPMEEEAAKVGSWVVCMEMALMAAWQAPAAMRAEMEAEEVMAAAAAALAAHHLCHQVDAFDGASAKVAGRKVPGRANCMAASGD